MANCEAIITSPPYAESLNTGESGIDWKKAGRPERDAPAGSRHGVQGASMHEMKYGSTPGQIGSLPAGKLDAVCTSPPWEDSTLTTDKEFIAAVERDQRRGSRFQGGNDDAYGASEGQVGQESGDSYWAAMRVVYDQCRLALKPGGVLVVVLKDFVKGGRRVPLVDESLKLLEHVGFIPVERVRAMLVKETRHDSLFGGEIVQTKSRKSFFRRLAEAKGSPRIDYEEVLIMQRPLFDPIPERTGDGAG